MNAQLQPVVGTLLEGGHFAGKILIAGVIYGLIVAPKALGQHDDAAWIARSKDVPGALSFNDGLANTQAMADAGSKLAKWALGLSIEGFSDWYVPALDELEICYRAFKPTTEMNSLYGRSGINVSAVPPTYPYSDEVPLQTVNPLFHAGCAEAFDDVWYWSSTQHADNSGYAWYQYFDNGDQDSWRKDVDGRARAVRRFKI